MTENGGTAFPESYIGTDAPHEGVGNGMSLRDYFAGQALVAVGKAKLGYSISDEAELAYALADAMLAERNKKA